MNKKTETLLLKEEQRILNEMTKSFDKFGPANVSIPEIHTWAMNTGTEILARQIYTMICHAVGTSDSDKIVEISDATNEFKESMIREVQKSVSGRVDQLLIHLAEDIKTANKTLDELRG